MNLGELKTRLQQHFSDGLAIVVGSGLSCAEGLPSMAELAEHLISTIPPKLTGNDVEVWEEIQPVIQARGLEAALIEHAPSPALERLIAVETAALVSERELAVVQDVFNGVRQLRLTRLIAHVLKPDSGVPIITTNYDRLIEVAVEEAGLGVDTMFSGRFAGVLNEKESRLSFCRQVTLKARTVRFGWKPRARVYKPHGSLDWYLRNETPVFYGGDLPDVPRLIITPGVNKFRNGYDSPFDLHRSRANEAIDRASRFLILGYGFNDDHLETHLSPAIRSGRPTLMMTRTLSRKAERLARDHSNIVALDCAERDDEIGTRFISGTGDVFIRNLCLWDVGSFVSEVLEP